MSKRSLAKVDKSTRKAQRGSRSKGHGNARRNGKEHSVRRTVLNSLTGEASLDRYSELLELSTRFSAKLKISPSLESRWRNTRTDAACNGTVAGKTEERAASNFSEAVHDDTTHPAQLAGTSQASQCPKVKAKNAKHGIEQKCKNSAKEKRKSDRTKTVSTDSRYRTKNLITDQADTYNRLTTDNKENNAEAHRIAEAENKSSTVNVSKEYYSKEIIIKGNAKKKTKNAEKAYRTKKIFSDHIPPSQMKKILKNNKRRLSNNVEYVKGNLRVNPSFFKYAYLRMDNEERDLLIVGIPSRNRAFDGDLVVACVNPVKAWHKCPDGQLQKTGKIVCILEKLHSRKAVGYVKKQESLLVFHPKDQRIPLVDILPESVPSLYHERPDLYKNVMFLINIDFWEHLHASGRVLSVVGKGGEIDAELQAIMLANNLDVSPYQEALLEGLPDSDYVLTDADMKDREDWRHECTFTIDPATAVDVDDAVSCKVLDNGNYEVAVHISDVTHYLEFFSPLDMEVVKRATTVYLPHMAYHMLPEKLCKACSLLAGKDRLAFSVIWEVTPDAEIGKHRFAKTVVRSCCQMSYDSAQAMLDSPEKSWPDDFLDIKGDYTASLLSDTVNRLFKLSAKLRDRRFVNGALRLDQPKLQIRMDTSQEHGFPMPVDYYLHERTDSNSLIEEFMLLANMTVAVQLYTAMPRTALLRIHKDPSNHCLKTARDTLQKYGIHLDIESAGALQASIHRYDLESSSAADNSMRHIMMVLTNLCSKSMSRAEYVCASAVSSHDLNHYALNVPLYTHFTSPIRRYSDCIVHHLLGAMLEGKPLPERWSATLCSKIAANCNVKKYSAKLAQEQSTELFFAYMVGLAGGFDATATVMYVKEESIDVALCDTGIKMKINLKDLRDAEHIATLKYSADYVPTVTVNWKESSTVQVINLFSLVRVQVTKITDELRLKAILLPSPSE